MHLRPVTLREANAFVQRHHRHHGSSRGWRFGVGLEGEDGDLVGVAVAGRPVARALEDGRTLEVTRCCVLPGLLDKSGCSRLYGAIRRAAKALGYTRLITYTLASESGISLRASGFTEVATVRGRSWDAPSRPRVDKHPTEDKIRWEVQL